MADKEQVNQAFGTVVQAINLALAGRFPIGLEHLDVHVQVKGALEMIGGTLKEHFSVASPGETTPEAPQSDASKKKDE